MSLYLDQEDDLGECSHPSVEDGVCNDCFCQVTELDARPGFSLGNKRVSSADYASGTTNSIHGVIKTFSERTNISHISKSVIADVSSLYDKISGKTVMRGTQRLGVIASCLKQTLLRKGIYISEKKLISLFGIHKKDLSSGDTLLSAVETLLVPSIPLVISNACKILGVKNKDVVCQAIKFSELLRHTHHSFTKTSTPSVGTGLLYSYFELKPSYKKYIPKTKLSLIETFSKELDISEITIKNIYATVIEVMETARSKKDV